ncbi:MAG TPA: hypothetical protein VHL98_10955 [Microvirga sp.]|jgi:hypothetical protein|nr:hypothetical protein [Microvirga sp.]
MTPWDENTDLEKAIKAAFDEDVEQLGGVTAFARRTRLDAARISRCTNISEENKGHQVPADVILDSILQLRRRGGESRLLQLLVHCSGNRMVPAAEPVENGAALLNHAIDITESVSALQTELMKAAADGRTDPAEVQRIVARARNVATDVAELENDLGAQPANVVGLRTGRAS